MDKLVCDGIINALDGMLDSKGMIVRDKETGKRLELDSDKVDIEVKAEQYFGCHMVTYVLLNMFKDGKIDFCCGEDDRDYKYLMKLIDDIEE